MPQDLVGYYTTFTIGGVNAWKFQTIHRQKIAGSQSAVTSPHLLDTRGVDSDVFDYGLNNIVPGESNYQRKS
ncbi:hypothetical protein K2Y11_01505 [bacterium]|nr:hypothetical protein [bacterium]